MVPIASASTNITLAHQKGAMSGANIIQLDLFNAQAGALVTSVVIAIAAITIIMVLPLLYSLVKTYTQKGDAPSRVSAFPTNQFYRLLVAAGVTSTVVLI